MRATTGVWILFTAATVLFVDPARAQYQPLSSPSQLEPLSPAQASPEEDPPLDYFDLDAWMAGSTGPMVPRDDWTWQILPDGIIYKAYLANPKESRLGTLAQWPTHQGELGDCHVGG